MSIASALRANADVRDCIGHPPDPFEANQRTMTEPLFIYVDVDDTLIRKGKDGAEEPVQKVIEHVCDLHRQGALLYCWSTGGEDHARATAQKLGIEDCFTGFLHKPQVFIDDERAEEWPHFVHVPPDDLRSFEEYQREVREKKDGKTGKS